jgi:hypothetical protein
MADDRKDLSVGLSLRSLDDSKGVRMPEHMLRDLDPVDELRLRRWAREHYAAAEDRDAGWHPIVLEEMEQKDRELVDARFHPRRAAGAYVPLGPSPGRFFIIDEAHAMGANRKVLLSVETVE